MKTKSLNRTILVAGMLVIMSVSGIQAQKSCKNNATSSFIKSVIFKNEIRHENSERIAGELDRIQEKTLQLADWMFKPSKFATAENETVLNTLQADAEPVLTVESWMTETGNILPVDSKLAIQDWMVVPGTLR